jgi:3-oxoacyl-[acyl-carrier protein] reductase
MNLELSGKVAIVTGSSRGLGLASAGALAAEGCHVTICARGADRLAEAAQELAVRAGAGAQILAVAADLSTETGVRAVVDQTVSRFGGVDVLVNNIGLARGSDLLHTTDAEWQEAFDHTLFPAVRASRLVLPSMRTRGAGVIIIVSSIFGREAGGRMTYNVVKAAEISLVKSLAQQLARAVIRKLRGAGHCVLFSSHVMQEVAALCDDIVIIDRGRVVAAGSPDELRARFSAASLEDAFVAATGDARGLE